MVSTGGKLRPNMSLQRGEVSFVCDSSVFMITSVLESHAYMSRACT